ncbi:hypothetical protein AK830_g4464 [Neonectria ditissima]|uniref:FAD-binding domain-containing protein n=1 Tax=Neonectria ditissima TaxID=78410 RepID=A0A0P7B8E6_9HYPO|nr:hypothetical protein AK830_g4464 [Neonectria ditissima]
MDRTELTVIIVGGSVSGLSLANMLEKAGIRFVLLEANDDIAPQVGASIGLQPNGLRILDQLGCADELISLVDMPLQNSYIRVSDGSAIAHHRNVHDNIMARHGYPTIFIDRQMLLETLYNNLRSKAPVMVGQRVESITRLDDLVEVVTSKGETFRGDILVGADGIFSTVRKEMWRIGNDMSPGYFPLDEGSKVPCDYKCIFGISRPIAALTKGVHYVHNQYYSYLIITGPGGRVYWFLFAKLDTTLFGKDIPRYSKSDEEELARQHASDPITPTVAFGVLYAARTSSVLTPLHEYVYEKWHFERVMTIGDAAHKFEPLTGFGGNSAIETAATLTNYLVSKKDSALSRSEIHDIFSNTQNDRFQRVSSLVADAHARQQNDAHETPLLAFLARVLPRIMSQEATLQLLSNKLVGASRLEMFPVPKRGHSIPYNDELPAKPLRSTWLPTSIAAICQYTLYQFSNKLLLPLEIPSSFAGVPVRRQFLGIGFLDELLSTLVSVFGVPLTGPNQAQKLQLAYFTPVIFSSVVDWTIESYRAGGGGTLISYPSLFGVAYQILGIGRIAPLYNLATLFTHVTHRAFGTAAGRPVAKEVADSLIPSLTLGYILPTVAMFGPFQNKHTWQGFVALWQPFPIIVGLLTSGISPLSKRLASRKDVTAKQTKQREKPQKNATPTSLRLIYAVGATASALAHFWSMYRIWKSPELSFSQVFGRFGGLLSASHASDPQSDILLFFQRDMFLNIASVFVQNIYRIFHLRALGYVTTKEAGIASAATVLAQGIIGPAATQIGLCGWREEVFSRVNRLTYHTQGNGALLGISRLETLLEEK